MIHKAVIERNKIKKKEKMCENYAVSKLMVVKVSLMVNKVN